VKSFAFNELYAEVAELKPNFVIITETWLTDKQNQALFTMDGYQAFRKDREGRRGGGVMVYVQDNFYVTEISNGLLSEYEIIIIKFKSYEKSHDSIIIALYHPPKPNYSEEVFLESLSTFLEDWFINNPLSYVYILGDVNQLNMGEVCLLYNIKQMVSKPTHGNKIIDVFMTNAF
jgi:hypothetical protein